MLCVAATRERLIGLRAGGVAIVKCVRIYSYVTLQERSVYINASREVSRARTFTVTVLL